MAHRESRTLSLTPEQAAFLTTCVESGRYGSASEVVCAALRLLEHEESRRAGEMARVRGMVQAGVDQLDRGDTVSAAEFFREWEDKHERAGRDPRAGG